MKMEIKNMKDIIKMVNQKEKGYNIMKMEINIMKEIIKMVSQKEKE